MTQFETQLGYPTPAAGLTPSTGTAGRSGVAARLAAGARALLRSFLRAVDEAPFDLAWPPSAHAAAERAVWRERWADAEARRGPGR